MGHYPVRLHTITRAAVQIVGAVYGQLSVEDVRFDDVLGHLIGLEYRPVIVDVVDDDGDGQHLEISADVRLDHDVEMFLARGRQIADSLPVDLGRRVDGAVPFVDGEHGRRLQRVGIEECVDQIPEDVSGHGMQDVARVGHVANERPWRLFFHQVEHQVVLSRRHVVI